MQTKEIDIREYEKLPSLFRSVEKFVKKNYLEEIKEYDVVKIPEYIKEISFRKSIRLLKINRIVYDKSENISDKLASVYNAVLNNRTSVIMIVDSDGVNSDIYIGVKDCDSKKSITTAKDTLEKSLIGNFPGIDIENMDNNCIENISEKLKKDFVSSVTGIPSFKGENENGFSQGIEKLLTGMKGEVFTAVFIADPITGEQIDRIRNGYEKIYSQIYPFSETTLSFGENDSTSITQGITQGITNTLNESISDSTSFSQGSSKGDTKTKNYGALAGIAAGTTGAVIGSVIPGVGTLVGGAIGGFVGSIAGTFMGSNSKSYTETSNVTKGETNTRGSSYAKSEQTSSSDTQTTGNSKQMQVKFCDKTISETLKNIEKQLERINESESYGMWNCSGYFVSKSYNSVAIAANQFRGIIGGNDSNIEKAVINIWDKEEKNSKELKEYISRFHHPLIEMSLFENAMPEITPTSMISGKEMSIFFGLPRKSLAGVPVISMAEFGKTVISKSKDVESKYIKMGKIFNLGKEEENMVNLNLNSLASHTFITGSTGAGKSNTIYKMIKELSNKEIPFLVIEPAKGDYKNIFGGLYNVRVFGTNEKFAPLLKINPFKFTEEIHVLEHIDRVIEIFNACWPMYAAMPAVLKKAIERIYAKTGWDLRSSIFMEDDVLYPSFNDLLKELPLVINESGYSEEIKNNYIGALVTRVESLVNGITGLIFSQNEIEDKVLFDSNCIIDLSRIGSNETKALIMGMLFLKLHEYRMSNPAKNSNLKHVTILEEAHNLLRKTSFGQSDESANLQGKAVEMISNAIAEMRTYGEGFIIADQSPGLLDESVIRNTNTKIILRLPDENDRILVGKSAGLNEEQIIELSRLETGVAAIYQNNWLEPVLCKVDEFLKEDETPLVYKFDIKEQSILNKKNRSELLEILLNGIMDEKLRKSIENIDYDRITLWIKEQEFKTEVKNVLLKDMEKLKLNEELELCKKENYTDLAKIVGELFKVDALFADSNKKVESYNEWTKIFKTSISKYVTIENIYQLELTKLMLMEKKLREEAYNNIFNIWNELYCRGEIL